jgi:hypothetical protein
MKKARSGRHIILTPVYTLMRFQYPTAATVQTPAAFPENSLS